MWCENWETQIIIGHIVGKQLFYSSKGARLEEPKLVSAREWGPGQLFLAQILQITFFKLLYLIFKSFLGRY